MTSDPLAADDLEPATVLETAARIRDGRQSAVATVEAALRRIARHNDALNAFVWLDPEGALAAARAVDAALAAGRDPGPLAGVPFGVKDLDQCIGMPTTYGSLLYRGGPPATHEPPLVARLRAAGAIPLGKTATPEFGWSSSTRSRVAGITRNPWRLERTPGGSSGGTAAAVASGMLPFGTGTDIGGSIRSPAAFCSLVGLKPSQGLIPSDGRVGPAQFPDMHVWGVLTPTVLDTALLLGIAAGPNAADRTSLGHLRRDYVAAAETLDVRGLRAGWLNDLGSAVVDPEVVAICEAAAARLIDAAELVRHDITTPLPPFRGGPLGAMELRGYLEADGLYPERAAELGEEVRVAIERFSTPSFAEQGQIHYRRAALQRAIADVFESVEVLMLPTTACSAFPAGKSDATVIAGRDARNSGSEPFTGFANACWLPAISVPAGLSSEGLPVGLQIVAPWGRDDLVLRLSRILEQAQPWPWLREVRYS